MTKMFNVAHIEHRCLIYGPGSRTAIWFQGCDIHCKGCWNSDLWDTSVKNLMSPEELHDKILSDNPDGVTFLGGEPLLQAELLLPLMQRLKEENINMMLYTGHEPCEIEASETYSKICSLANILIPGRYKESERDIGLKWRGSRNQPILGMDRIEDGDNMVEIRIDESGKITCLGYPDDTIRSIIGLKTD